MGGFATEISFEVHRDWSSLQNPNPHFEISDETLSTKKEKKSDAINLQSQVCVYNLQQLIEENLETQSIHL